MTEIPDDYRAGRVALSWSTVIGLTLITMVMLTLMQEPMGWGFLAWVALLPWVLATAGAKSGGRGAIISYVFGLAYYLINLYWLIPVTPPGYGALCFYLAWYFVLTGYIMRRVYQRRRWPFTFVLPVVWVGQEYLRAIIFTGFPWLFLSHSQHENFRLMQVCDLFGAYGLTFLVAMVNGLLCDLLLRPLARRNVQRPHLGALALIVLTIFCLTDAMLYGIYRVNQGQQTITEGPTIALVQEVIPQYVKESGESNEEIFARHLRLSEQTLAGVPRPDLIVWPETMTCCPMNKEFLELQAPRFNLDNFTWLQHGRDFDKRLRELAGQGSAVLVGTPAVQMGQIEYELRPLRKWNSAILYLSDGSKYARRYDKMHLVPFGEVVPFRESCPPLYRLLSSLTPYDYEYTLDVGKDPTVFTYEDRQERAWRFAVAICYEDVMPQVPRRLTVAKGEKRVDFLLNISNDGWFVTGAKDEPIKPSAELIQHLVICKFRAVENRVGIARAVNTGISAFIRPDGIVQEGFLEGNLPEKARQRQAVAGFATDKVYLDTRVSIYSRVGDIFAIICTALAALLLLDGIRCQRREKKTIQLQMNKNKHKFLKIKKM